MATPRCLHKTYKCASRPPVPVGDRRESKNFSREAGSSCFPSSSRNPPGTRSFNPTCSGRSEGRWREVSYLPSLEVLYKYQMVIGLAGGREGNSWFLSELASLPAASYPEQLLEIEPS